MKSYFKTRSWFKFSSHRYEVGRLFAKNKRYADNFFLLKVYELPSEEYDGFYNFHLRHYLRANEEDEQEFYEHVWHIVGTRIKYLERKSPFSSSHETVQDGIRSLKSFHKFLGDLDKWNARPYPVLLEEKDKRILELQQQIVDLKKKVGELTEYEVQQKVEIKEGYLPVLIDLIKQLPELELPGGRLLLKCYNKSPYYKLISKYFMHGDKPIPLETARNYYVSKEGDIPAKGTLISEDSKLFRIVRVNQA